MEAFIPTTYLRPRNMLQRIPFQNKSKQVLVVRPATKAGWTARESSEQQRSQTYRSLKLLPLSARTDTLQLMQTPKKPHRLAVAQTIAKCSDYPLRRTPLNLAGSAVKPSFRRQQVDVLLDKWESSDTFY